MDEPGHQLDSVAGQRRCRQASPGGLQASPHRVPRSGARHAERRFVGDAARLSGGGPRGAFRQPRRVQGPKSRLLGLLGTWIKAARGYQVSGNGFVGENILFADGPFLYLVGEGSTVGRKKSANPRRPRRRRQQTPRAGPSATPPPRAKAFRERECPSQHSTKESPAARCAKGRERGEPGPSRTDCQFVLWREPRVSNTNAVPCPSSETDHATPIGISQAHGARASDRRRGTLGT